MLILYCKFFCTKISNEFFSNYDTFATAMSVVYSVHVLMCVRMILYTLFYLQILLLCLLSVLHGHTKHREYKPTQTWWYLQYKVIGLIGCFQFPSQRTNIIYITQTRSLSTCMCTLTTFYSMF